MNFSQAGAAHPGQNTPPRPKSGGFLATVIILAVAVCVGGIWAVVAVMGREVTTNNSNEVSHRAQTLLEGLLAGDQKSTDTLLNGSYGRPAGNPVFLGGSGAIASLGENPTVSIDSVDSFAGGATANARVTGSKRGVSLSISFKGATSRKTVEEWTVERIDFPKVELSGSSYAAAWDLASTQLNGVDIDVKNLDNKSRTWLLWPGPARFTVKDSQGNSMQDTDPGILSGNGLTVTSLTAANSDALGFVVKLEPVPSRARAEALYTNWLKSELDGYVKDPETSPLTPHFNERLPGPLAKSSAEEDPVPQIRNLQIKYLNIPKDTLSLTTSLPDEEPHFFTTGVEVTVAGQWKDGSTWRNFEAFDIELSMSSGSIDFSTSKVTITNPKLDQNVNGGK